MSYLILVLRVIHVLGGIFWVGAALLMNFFVGPTWRTGDAEWAVASLYSADAFCYDDEYQRDRYGVGWLLVVWH
jgi:hypothetical protein